MYCSQNDNGEATSLKNQDTGTEYIGGGSSDFSTANVTINNAGDGLLIALIDGGTTISGMFNSGTISAILYKGAAVAEVNDESQNITINSGAATYPEPDNHKFVLITGDCTITIS